MVLKLSNNMCYGGKCRWEGYMGDCNFPKTKAVREKYHYPVCEIFDDNLEERQKTIEAIADIIDILEKEKNSLEV